MSATVDERALVHSDAIGDGCRIGPYAVVGPRAVLGREVVVGTHAIVRADARLGDAVTVEDGAIVGIGATVHDGATVGTGATVVPAVEVGHGAVVSEGAVVTRTVPRHAVVAGNPGLIIGYVGLDGPAPMEPVRFGAADDVGAGVVETAVQGVRLHRVQHVRDLRGSLVAAELGDSPPFVPRRYFMVFDVPSAEVRGEHAHRVCHQYLTAVQGDLHVIADDGEHRQEFVLDDERIGLHLPPMVWGVQYRYSKDCKLLVLASHPYDADDYIRDYGLFLREARGEAGQ